MLETENKGKTSAGTPLGNYLASIRDDRKMTLRDVEEATRKEVSNAYLSQIEKGHIKQPSPNVLNALADIYAISFQGLMEMAGYLTNAKQRLDSSVRHGRLATFSEHNLTSAEEEELMRYLKFIRSRNSSGDES